MTILLIIIAIAIIVGVVIFRLYLSNQAKKLSEEISLCSDIKADLEKKFHDRQITNTNKENLLGPYEDNYLHGEKLSKWLDRFHVSTPEGILQLVNDYEGIDRLVERHNEKIENDILDKESAFFDTCLKYPLDLQQRRSIIAEEDNVLVVSSAGSGKTSSIVGKVKYLTQIKKINLERILLISYTHKAAAELTERAGAKGLRGYTFHKLALDLLGKATGEKPSVCDNTDSFLTSSMRHPI